jgi:hypothetical protein
MPAVDSYGAFAAGPSGPYDHAAAVTPHDTNELPAVASAIHVGGAGNVALVTAGGDAVTLTGCLAGHVYRVRAKQVKSTNTTATALVALW